MSGSLSSRDVREKILELLHDRIISHSSIEEQPFNVEFKDPLPNKVSFYVYGLGEADDEHGHTINVRLDKTNDEGHIITLQAIGSQTMFGGLCSAAYALPPTAKAVGFRAVTAVRLVVVVSTPRVSVRVTASFVLSCDCRLLGIGGEYDQCVEENSFVPKDYIPS